MSCSIKHTKYQPSNAEWRCPGCGSDNNFFTIFEPVENADVLCDLLHEADGVECAKCQRGWLGRSIARIMMKKANQVACPTCKGCGTVAK